MLPGSGRPSPSPIRCAICRKAPPSATGPLDGRSRQRGNPESQKLRRNASPLPHRVLASRGFPPNPERLLPRDRRKRLAPQAVRTPTSHSAPLAPAIAPSACAPARDRDPPAFASRRRRSLAPSHRSNLPGFVHTGSPFARFPLPLASAAIARPGRASARRLSSWPARARHIPPRAGRL